MINRSQHAKLGHEVSLEVRVINFRAKDTSSTFTIYSFLIPRTTTTTTFKYQIYPYILSTDHEGNTFDSDDVIE